MKIIKAIVAGVVATATTFAAPSLGGSFHVWQVAAGLVAGLTAFSAVYWAPKNATT